MHLIGSNSFYIPVIFWNLIAWSFFKIVVVPNAQAAEKVPPIPGMLAYRKDNEELYVRADKTWKIIAQNEKVIKLDKEFNNKLEMFLNEP